MASSPEEPARPSTWKLLFGKNKHHHHEEDDDGLHCNDDNNADDIDDRLMAKPKTQQAAPEDVTAQLLSALHARERGETPQELLGRECSEQLLGKRNAFVPQLRLDEKSVPVADASRAAAREIISARFQVEQRAQAIRQGKTQEKLRRDDVRQRPVKAVRADAATTPGMTERLKKLREIQARREDRETQHLQQQQQQEKAKQKRAKEVATKPSRLVTAKVSGRVHQIPDYRTARQPVESMQAPAVAKSTRPEVKSGRKVPAKADEERTASSKSNQDDIMDHSSHYIPETVPLGKPTATKHPIKASGAITTKPTPSTREFRQLDEKLRQLKVENQQGEELEAKLQKQQQLQQIKRRVWAIWRERVDRRQRQAASVTRAFQWRQLQKVWGKWRSYVRTSRREREAEATRAQMVREKHSESVAEQFYRHRQLTVWFVQWRSVVSALKEARALDREMHKRREQAQRLIERFARKEESNPAKDEEEDEEEDEELPVTLKLTRSRLKGVPQQKDLPRALSQTTTSRLRPKVAWAAEESGRDHQLKPVSMESKPPSASSSPPPSSQATKPKSAPSPDAFYVSMQERAEQRKLQREQLKHKYEQLEQAKREALALQVAEREALLGRHKQEERERLRQKKREETRLAKEKATVREVEAIKLQSAQLHDRLRLLFHYAWRPWHAQWLTSKRIARNATKWHGLRVSHRVWLAWTAFVDQRRAERRQLEREKLQIATQHHGFTVLRRSLAAWMQVREATQQRELALRRQTQWNETRRWWRKWHEQYAVVLSEQQRKEQRVTRQLNRTRLRGLLLAWRNAAVESKRERVRLAEKELLWKKARGWLNDS